MLLFIPKNLDFEELIIKNPPTFKKTKFKIEKLLYIIHLIIHIPLVNKLYRDKRFIPINSTLLQSKIHNYTEYLDYLVNILKIVECDNQYISGKKSKGYKLKDYYQTEVIIYEVMDCVFKKALSQEKTKNIEVEKKLYHLTKWFNDLSMDFEEAMKFAKTQYKIQSKTTDIPNITNSFNYAKMSIYKIFKRDFFMIRDLNVYRFHSNLTNMPSMLRNALSYNGENLISIDIKNSQPYFSTILMNPLFWRKEKNGIKTSDNGTKTSDFFNLGCKSTDFQLIINIYKLKCNNIIPYIMLEEILGCILKHDFSYFINLVVTGKLYEFLQEEIKTEHDVVYNDRKGVKAMVFLVLFSHNNFLGQPEAKPKKLFKNLFPEVYSLFEIIKRKDKTLLPRLLQNIESYLIVDVIAKRISEEYPLAPIFTIHDSIATTPQYVDIVEQVMNEELYLKIGQKPKLKREYWNINNLKKV
ncbi:hypothetical protein [Confluentibacter flavum]|uniref:DNA-directed RNA polymerase n=1 Tax=Confluentibacter flavum TaxID=1909700 RepID=A0A2N3HMJ6_9FLAO|nr:hypothetical protein [Confluentibacter flavum]PKQ46068.1 hypothetical protein CSW08_04825 [Confluentibacter flavum]